MLQKSQVCVPNTQWGPSILNIRVWNRERFITDSYKEMGGSCTKNFKVTESFQQVHVKAKGEGWVWLVIADFSVSDALFLRSGHGQVMMFLQISTRWMLFSVLTRKGKVPRHNFHPPRFQPWLREGRSQLTALQGQVPTSCPLVMPEGARHPSQLALSLLRPPTWGDQVSQTMTRQMATAIKSQRQGWGRGSPLPQGLDQG